ncbi:MAG: repressor LexA [Dehalococcoidia bacterium]|jgi:repressor LexA|uniref:transcriptional repressor LexA n=1 Tax=Candidatus Amarobacter glycogenicus TaxID=3140699 RepID=UPI002A0D211E|nr:repressor LexA [Dehalococcoidia bacterium]MBK7329149.1 repressor LexA [Dehalococcoidia bacterium]MBK8560245.1 repressor LexA [Dehalococcoidia bacterium]MBK9342019.1 repressor LexA [Dehalococcoidia bacterium]MBK9544660.1 repressor LexA [Dehalococcoidia bacterium]
MKELSSKQDQILDFLRTFIEDKDYPPSIRDIQEGCSISSTSVVDYNLRKLEEKGMIRRDREVSRGIEVLGSKGGRRARIIEIPVIGAIAAGQPIPVPSSERWSYDAEDTVAVTEDMVRGKTNVFALRVKGKSMIEDLIDDGDIVFLEPARAANDGEKVAVWLKDRGEVTLKRIYHEGNRVRLQPANSSMQPIYTSPDNVEIQGRFISSIRPSD